MAAGVFKRLYIWALVFSFLWLMLLVSDSDAVHPSAVYRSFHQNDRFILPSPNSSVSPKCVDAFNKITINQSFAYLDGMGKPQSGIELGNVAWLGSYSECNNLTGAHYCLASIKINIPRVNQTLPVQWGLCVPKDCSDDDVTNGLEMIFNQTKDILQLNDQQMYMFGTSQQRSVHCAKPSTYTPGVIATLALCGVILFLCAVGTFWDIAADCMKQPVMSSSSKNDSFLPVQHDSTPGLFSDDSNADLLNSATKHGVQSSSSSIPVLVHKNTPGWQKFIQCFSLIKNTSHIMDTQVPSGAITSINGMRVLSMWWVILGHVFVWQLIGGNVSNLLLAFTELLTRFSFQAVANAFFSVDSFFFLSGLLVSYLSFRQMDRCKGHLPLLKFYFHRFWRLTPTYMFVLLFYTKLTGFLGKGPMWFQLQANPACDKYWWTNLLYINNFWPTGLQKECMNWSWYLANDMQFYIISPIILLAANRFGKLGFLITSGTLLLGHFITTAIIMAHYNLDASMLGGGENPNNRNQEMPDFTSLVYIKPYCRIGPYLVGMGLGYLMHLQRSSARRPHWILMLVGWCVAIVLALSVVYGPYKSYKKNPVPFTKLENVMYGTFSRFAWGLALAWVIYACHRGFGGKEEKDDLKNKILEIRM